MVNSVYPEQGLGETSGLSLQYLNAPSEVSCHCGVRFADVIFHHFQPTNPGVRLGEVVAEILLCCSGINSQSQAKPFLNMMFLFPSDMSNTFLGRLLYKSIGLVLFRNNRVHFQLDSYATGLPRQRLSCRRTDKLVDCCHEGFNCCCFVGM